MMRNRVIFRFNMIEVALALVILAIGLSSVLVLFPVGLKASRQSIADNNLADVAERVGAYIQSKYTSSEVWGRDGTFNGGNIGNFDPEPGSLPEVSDFTTKADGMDGLLTASGHPNCYLYRQYSAAPTGSSTSDDQRAVDFEAMIRVGWDTATLKEQYYSELGSGTPKTLSSYSRIAPSGTDSVLTNGNLPNGNGIGAAVLDKCCRTLIIEISWPADVSWSKREKRIFRLEMFNENFVPYPQTQTTTP